MSDNIEPLIQQWDGLGVVSRFDRPTGSWVFICLHDDTLGPCMGGTRLKVYGSRQEALRDGMRLAAGMTSKWAGIGFEAGGGKAVLSVPKELEGEERRGLLARYGRLIESLRGAFQTGEDLGTSPADMEHLSRYTSHVHGFDPESGEKIDPGPFTAHGVLVGIRAALASVFGSGDVAGRVVLIQGLGNVGWELARRLVEGGAEILASDVDEVRMQRAQAELGARLVSPLSVYTTPCDVYAPCALGATLNQETIAQLGCRIVAGSANNQLAEISDAQRLSDRSILYVPDYVINAGGAVAFGALHREARSREALFTEVEGLGSTVAQLLQEAADRHETPLEAAQRRVRDALSRGQSGA